MLVFWLFDFGCCSLVQETSFVDRYLPYFRQWLITHLLSACLLFQAFFTESSHGDHLFALAPFSSAAAYRQSNFSGFI
jgi:hypothetical protein